MSRSLNQRPTLQAPAESAAISAFAPLANPIAFFGDSLPSYGEGFPNHVAGLSMQRIQISSPAANGLSGKVLIFSYPGYDTATLKTKVGDLLAIRPRPHAVVVNGGTNDTIAATPLATTMANLKWIYAAFEAAGIRVIMSTIPPLGGPYQYNGKQQPARSVNVAVRELAFQTGRYVVDPFSALIDKSTQRYQAAYDSGDNVHPSGAGIQAWANKIISDLSPLFAPAPTIHEQTVTGGATGANLYPDATLSSGGGNNGGTSSAGLALNLSCTTARASIVPSLVADSGGLFTWQRFTVSDTSGTGLYYGPSITLTPGHVMKITSRVRTGQSGGAFRLLFSQYHGSFVTDENIPMNCPNGTGLQIPDSAQCVYFTVPATATSGQLQISIPAVVGTYDFALPTIYDLTALGVV